MSRSGTGSLYRRAMMTRPVRLGQIGEEPQVVAQVGRREEVLTDYLAAKLTHLARPRRIAHQLQHALAAFLDAVDQIAGLAVLDLQWDASDIAANDWLALPQPFGDGQAESLT